MKHLNLFVLLMMLLMCLPSANAQVAQPKKSIHDYMRIEVWDSDYGEVMPQFPGGDTALLNYIKNNLRYPPKAKEKGVQGRVIVKFYIETDGNITDAKVFKSPDSLLNDEAIRIVKSMPKWKPGAEMSNGKITLKRFNYVIPIIFKLDNNKTDSFQYVIDPKKNSH